MERYLGVAAYELGDAEAYGGRVKNMEEEVSR